MNYFIFEMLKKKNFGQFSKNYRTLYRKMAANDEPADLSSRRWPQLTASWKVSGPLALLLHTIPASIFGSIISMADIA